MKDRPMTNDELMAGLPGEQLVRTGISDLVAGRRTVASLLVSVAGARLAEVVFGPTRPGRPATTPRSSCIACCDVKVAMPTRDTMLSFESS